MKKYLLLVVIVLAFAVGCGPRAYVFSDSIIPNLNLTPNDIILGEKISFTMDYSSSFDIKDKLYNAALAKYGYDMIVLPRYSIQDNLFTDTITITGYGAKLKGTR